MHGTKRHAPPKPPRLIALAVGLTLMPLARGVELEGRAVDPSGAGLAGTIVWVDQGHDVVRAQTDEGGAFALPGLDPVPADVVAWQEGRAVGGAHVAVLGLEPVTLVLGEGDTLRIVVKSAGGDPLAGARIKHLVVNDAFEVPIEALAAHDFHQPRSDADGRLLVADLPKGGHVRFVLAHRDCADTRVAYLPVGGKEHAIVLAPGVTVRGRVTTPEGDGLARARVAAFAVGAADRTQPAEAVTDAEGFYHVRVRRGKYLVAARHPDYASPRPRSITLVTQSDANVVDVVMPRPHVIEGTVVFADGKPCIGAPVSYWIEDALYEEVLTQRDGRFRLQTPGIEGVVRVSPPDGCMSESTGDIAVTGTVGPQLVLAPVTLVPLPAVEGVVVDQDNQPQQRAVIASVDLETPVWAVTDEAGRFRIRLRQTPPASKASFRAEHALRFRRGAFEVNLAEPSLVTVRLEPFEPDQGPRDATRGENDLRAMVGEPAPEIACSAWFNSEPLALASLRNKVVVLLFWGAFEEHGPLRNAVEEWRALYDALRGVEDVAIVAIHDSVTEAASLEQRIEEYAIEFPVGLDAEPFHTFQAYEIRCIPQAVLIDKRGRLRYFQTEGRLLELIKGLRRET